MTALSEAMGDFAEISPRLQSAVHLCEVSRHDGNPHVGSQP
jgi:hypothetical protein